MRSVNESDIKGFETFSDCGGHQIDQHTVQQCKDHSPLPYHAKAQPRLPANQQSGSNIGSIQENLAGAIAHMDPLRCQGTKRLRGVIGKAAVFGNGKPQADQEHSAQEAQQLLEVALGRKMLKRWKTIAEKVQQNTVSQNGNQLKAAVPFEPAPQHQDLQQKEYPIQADAGGSHLDPGGAGYR